MAPGPPVAQRLVPSMRVHRNVDFMDPACGGLLGFYSFTEL